MDKLASGEFTTTKNPEFQVVIIIDGEDGRLFPLTETCPRCMLPIATRKLLSYQLDLLVQCGASEIYLVSSPEYQTQLSQFLAEDIRDSVAVELVIADEMMGSADGLRAVCERIRGDFICMGADFITNYKVLAPMVNMHRCRASDVTMLLAAAPIEEPEKKGGIKKVKIDEEDQEYIGLTSDGRVLIKSAVLDVEKSFAFSKPLLKRCTSMSIRNDLLDMGVYILSKWVLEFVNENKKLSSVRMDIVPYLIQRQYQPLSYLKETVVGLEHRTRTLSSLDDWLIKQGSSTKGEKCVDLLSCIADSLLEPINKCPLLSRASSVDSIESKATSSEDAEDLLRCFAHVIEVPLSEEKDKEIAHIHILNRITNLQSYMNMNRDVPLHHHNASTVWPRLVDFQKKELSVVSPKCEIGEKVTYKQCSIGSGSKIGTKTRINNCIIMENVTIGDNCTIQNSIICTGAIIESTCSLNDCFVGDSSKVAANSKIKSESIVNANM